jgi:ankyrin repeat protein
VNVRNNYDLTPLHEAVGSGNLDIAQLLLSHGADINTLDNYGTTLLHEGSTSGNLDVVEFLLKSGADVNVRNITTRLRFIKPQAVEISTSYDCCLAMVQM